MRFEHRLVVYTQDPKFYEKCFKFFWFHIFKHLESWGPTILWFYQFILVNITKSCQNLHATVYWDPVETFYCLKGKGGNLIWMLLHSKTIFGQPPKGGCLCELRKRPEKSFFCRRVLKRMFCSKPLASLYTEERELSKYTHSQVRSLGGYANYRLSFAFWCLNCQIVYWLLLGLAPSCSVFCN